MIKKIINKLNSNSLIMNSLILIVLSMIVKILSLLNRIILTRILGTDGISLYVLSIPTIMLFTSLGSFSLNISMSKLVSENEGTKEYNQISILKKGAIIAIIASFISILILLLILKPLTQLFLKNENTYYPILFSILFIPISSLNNTLKGYFNGLNKINISSISSLIEEIMRIISMLVIFVILPIDSLIMGVNYAIIAMTLGELCSLIFQIIKIKKYYNEYNTNSIPTSKIISNSLPTLSSRMIGNFTYFLEPIIYTTILLYLKNDSELITKNYGIINAYIVPIITICSFFSMSISTAILPNISKNYALGNNNLVRYYTKKSILICLIPGILITVLLTYFCKDYMFLIYGTLDGSSDVQKFAFFFQFIYISSPIIAIIQAIGKSKSYFIISTIFSVIKVILILVLSFIPSISFNSLLLSILITSILSTFIYYNYLQRKIKFKYSPLTICKVIIVIFLSYLFGYLIKLLDLNYILSSLIIVIFFIILLKLTNILIIDDK